MYRIKELRKMRKWNQKEVAEAIYTTQQQYSRIELGKTDISGFTLKRLASLYTVSTDYILGLTDNPKPYDA